VENEKPKEKSNACLNFFKGLGCCCCCIVILMAILAAVGSQIEEERRDYYNSNLGY